MVQDRAPFWARASMSAKTPTLGLVEGELQVGYGGAAVFLATDTDTPTGTEANLAVGLNVKVSGTLQVDGSVVVNSIRILAEASA